MAPLTKWKTVFSRAFQIYLDKSPPLPVHRWLGTLGVAAIYVLRVSYLQGLYIITCGFGIYILNLLIGFLSPKVDPELEALNGLHCLQKVLINLGLLSTAFQSSSFEMLGRTFVVILFFWAALTVIAPILIRLSASANLLDYNGEMKNDSIQSSKELGLLCRRALGSIQA